MLTYLTVRENTSSCRIITIGTNFEPIKWIVFIGFVFILIIVVVKFFGGFFHKVDTTRRPGVLVDKNGKPLKYGPSSPTPPDYVEEDDDERERRQKTTAKLVAGAIVVAYFIHVIFDIFSK